MVVVHWLHCMERSERRSSFDRPFHSFYDVKLVSPEERERERERETGRGEVRSLRADEIKRDDLAIHASSDDDDASDALSSCTVYVFWSNTVRQFSVFLQDILIKVHIAGSVIR